MNYTTKTPFFEEYINLLLMREFTKEELLKFINAPEMQEMKKPELIQYIKRYRWPEFLEHCYEEVTTIAYYHFRYFYLKRKLRYHQILLLEQEGYLESIDSDTEFPVYTLDSVLARSPEEWIIIGRNLSEEE